MAGRAAHGSGRRGPSWRLLAWGAGAALVLRPLGAMQVTDEVNWGLEDFVLAATLVASLGIAFELALREPAKSAVRAGAAVALVAAFLLIWINAAVGIIGSEENPANRMYAGVLAVGRAGAVVARFRSRGMACALVATALAQGLVATLLAGWGSAGAINVVFAGLWVLSAWLFQRAAQTSAGS